MGHCDYSHSQSRNHDKKSQAVSPSENLSRSISSKQNNLNDLNPGGLAHQGISDMNLTKDAEEALSDVFNELNDVSVNNEKCYALNGIIFQHQKKWTVFLNDQVFTKKSVSNDFNIISVEAHRILIQSKLNDKEPAKWLGINQSFCPHTCEIITSPSSETLTNSNDS